jgi:predicted transcriptional regulator
MPESSVQQRILEAERELPEDATVEDAMVEDAMECLYFLAKGERGLREADAGQTIPHEEAKRRLLG